MAPLYCAGGITEEQYQDHQQQLAQMQKQQLAQTSTAPVKHSSQPELKITQVGQCTLSIKRLK